MPRYALKIEYNGASFYGWQRQRTSDNTIQGKIENAIAAIDDARPLTVGAGRTDSGVHALGQVAHVDLHREWDAIRLIKALNAHLRPHPIAITAAQQVKDKFHARFDAAQRVYRYRIFARMAPLVIPAFAHWYLPSTLDIKAMYQAAIHFVGQHDFTTFRSQECQTRSPIKTLTSFDIITEKAWDGQLYEFNIAAPSFLHKQVRSLVGTLVEVGKGKWSPEQVLQALNACDRSACGQVAPPDGLVLISVDYPSFRF